MFQCSTLHVLCLRTALLPQNVQKNFCNYICKLSGIKRRWSVAKKRFGFILHVISHAQVFTEFSVTFCKCISLPNKLNLNARAKL